MATYVAEGGKDRVITLREQRDLLTSALKRSGRELSRLLVIPTDITRLPGRAGVLTQLLYLLAGRKTFHIIPALGTHTPHTGQENQTMFGDIPFELFFEHNWEADLHLFGEIPSDFVKEVSEGKLNYKIAVEVSKRLVEGLKSGTYTTAISIGPVFPHEVAGFSNGLKNILIGLGGAEFINKSHFLGAVYGMERMMGRLDTPVRKVLNYAHKEYLKDLGILYVLTVVGYDQNGQTVVRGLFIGDDENTHAQAAALSEEINLDKLDSPLERVVVYLNPEEYHSVWLGNKAVYRTRMALADNGELIVLAPGVRSFADDPKRNSQMERLIEKHGYKGTSRTLKAVKEDLDLANNLAVAAHLIHGSSEGRFRVIYATDENLLSKERVEGVGFEWLDIQEALARYNPSVLKDGLNDIPEVGEVYYVRDPSLVLLTTKDKLGGRS